MYALNDIIPKEHYIMWGMFVGACSKICKRNIKVLDVEDAHRTFIIFCKTFERLCGKEKVKPNMHMHLHLRDCLLHYGPVYAFWCFSFERFNGILGSYHINNHCITVQVMRKFVSFQQIKSMPEFISSDLLLNIFSKKN